MYFKVNGKTELFYRVWDAEKEIKRAAADSPRLCGAQRKI